MRALAFASLSLLVGCVDVAVGPQPQCKRQSDCDPGEACQEGVCWGNPPAGMFAATLGPPSGRTDLVPVEIPQRKIEMVKARRGQNKRLRSQDSLSPRKRLNS